LLAWSCGPGLPNGYIFNGDGLSTHEVLDYLWEIIGEMARTPVMFSAGYDFNCILRNLERKRARWLYKEQPILIGKYQVHYNQRTLRLLRKRRQIEIADVFRFYQCSFVKALEKNLPDYTGLDEIRANKALRSEFNFALQFNEILHYCLQELEALVLLSEKRDADLEVAGIGRTALYGAGSIAAKLMHTYHVKQHQVRPKTS
jgi:hypothetical protein